MPNVGYRKTKQEILIQQVFDEVDELVNNNQIIDACEILTNLQKKFCSNEFMRKIKNDDVKHMGEALTSIFCKEIVQKKEQLSC